jgi:hypothetical protein
MISGIRVRERIPTSFVQRCGVDAAPALDAFLQSCDAKRHRIWSFRTLVRGIEWDPALFTRVLDEPASKLGSTFEHASTCKHPECHPHICNALNFEERFAAFGFTKPRQS